MELGREQKSEEELCFARGAAEVRDEGVTEMDVCRWRSLPLTNDFGQMTPGEASVQGRIQRVVEGADGGPSGGDVAGTLEPGPCVMAVGWVFRWAVGWVCRWAEGEVCRWVCRWVEVCVMERGMKRVCKLLHLRWRDLGALGDVEGIEGEQVGGRDEGSLQRRQQVAVGREVQVREDGE